MIQGATFQALAPRNSPLGPGFLALAFWPWPPGFSPWALASAPRPWPQVPGVGTLALESWPRNPGLGILASGPWSRDPDFGNLVLGPWSQASWLLDPGPGWGPDGCTDLHTDERTEKISLVLYKTTSFWGRCPKVGIITLHGTHASTNEDRNLEIVASNC